MAPYDSSTFSEDHALCALRVTCNSYFALFNLYTYRELGT